eukprot:SAG11_NODE_1950_length_4013_cov_4.004854_2_plen_241_part_00
MFLSLIRTIGENLWQSLIAVLILVWLALRSREWNVAFGGYLWATPPPVQPRDHKGAHGARQTTALSGDVGATGTNKTVFHAALAAELQSMRLSEVRALAIRAGVSQRKLDCAERESSPRLALANLIMMSGQNEQIIAAIEQQYYNTVHAASSLDVLDGPERSRGPHARYVDHSHSEWAAQLRQTKSVRKRSGAMACCGSNRRAVHALPPPHRATPNGNQAAVARATLVSPRSDSRSSARR